MKILLVKTSSMGDLLHSLPALTDAANTFSDLSIDWVVEENFAEIPSWHPKVNKIIPIALRRWRKNLCSRKTWQEWKKFKQELRSTNYDFIIDAQGLFKSAFFVTRLAKGIKCGYDAKSAREGICSYFYDKSFNVKHQQHAVEKIRELFALSLSYQKPKIQGDYGISSKFKKALPSATPYMMLFHATTWDSKHWPEEKWHQLIQLLTKENIPVKLTWGNDKEKSRAEKLAKDTAQAFVIPKASLSELAVYIANAKACISVDTGLSHLAAALDTPNLTLFGPTDPKLVGGYGKNQYSLKKNSMQDIAADEVFLKLHTFLNL